MLAPTNLALDLALPSTVFCVTVEHTNRVLVLVHRYHAFFAMLGFINPDLEYRCLQCACYATRGCIKQGLGCFHRNSVLSAMQERIKPVLELPLWLVALTVALECIRLGQEFGTPHIAIFVMLEHTKLDPAWKFLETVSSVMQDHIRLDQEHQRRYSVLSVILVRTRQVWALQCQ